MFCGNCGNNIPDGSSFCGNCGTSIEEKDGLTVEEQFEEIKVEPIDESVAVSPTQTTEVEDPRESIFQSNDNQNSHPDKKRNKKFIGIISIILIALLLGGGSTYYFFFSTSSVEGKLKKALINHSFSYGGINIKLTEENLKEFDLEENLKQSTDDYSFKGKVKVEDELFNAEGNISGIYYKNDGELIIGFLNSITKGNNDFKLSLTLKEEEALSLLNKADDINIKKNSSSYSTAQTIPKDINGDFKVKEIKDSNNTTEKLVIVSINGYKGAIEYNGNFTAKFNYVGDKWNLSNCYFYESQSLLCSIKDITKADLANNLNGNLKNSSYIYSEDSYFVTLYQKDNNYTVSVDNVSKDKQDKIEKLTSDIKISIDNGDVTGVVTGRYTLIIEDGKSIKLNIEDSKVSECTIKKLSNDEIKSMIKIDSKLKLSSGEKTLSSNEIDSITINEITYSTIKSALAKGTIKLSNGDTVSNIEIYLKLDFTSNTNTYKWIIDSIYEK